MEVTTFYIYEVPGIKNGCTKDWLGRSQQNFEKYNILPVLVETLVYPDTSEYWQIVGDREFELAEMNEYPKGTHYRIARERRILGGKIAGTINIEAKTQIIIANRYTGGNKNIGKRSVESGHLAKVRNPLRAGEISRLIERTCLHCNRTIKGPNYHRWHGDKCKHKQI